MEENEDIEKIEKKNTNIIVLTDFGEYGDVAVHYASVLASIFHSSLTIIHNVSPRGHQATPVEPVFSAQFKQTEQFLDENNIKHFLLSDAFSHKDLYAYAEETNTIMFVIAVAPKKGMSLFTRRQAVKFIRPSRVPVMVVGNRMPDADVFKQVMLPLNIDRQSKEKALWAGYFSRYYGAMVHILFTTYRDEFLRKRVIENVEFTKKLYENLEVTYELHKIEPTVDNMDKYSLSFASQVGASLTVIMMTKYFSLIDFLFGPKEFALIGNKEGFPVLCINEREDLYVLCT